MTGIRRNNFQPSLVVWLVCACIFLALLSMALPPIIYQAQTKNKIFIISHYNIELGCQKVYSGGKYFIASRCIRSQNIIANPKYYGLPYRRDNVGLWVRINNDAIYAGCDRQRPDYCLVFNELDGKFISKSN